MPLVSSDESWNLLECRCREIASGDDDRTISELLDTLADALQTDQPPSSNARVRVSKILRFVCQITVERWNERGDPINLDILRSYHRAAGRLDPEPIQPNVQSSWEAITVASASLAFFRRHDSPHTLGRAATEVGERFSLIVHAGG